jgi:hypothetical protein
MYLQILKKLRLEATKKVDSHLMLKAEDVRLAGVMVLKE